MPRLSKAQVKGTRAKKATDAEVREEFFCCRCGRKYKKQKNNFPASGSMLYRGNGGYLATCNHCIDELYEHYKDTIGSDEGAIKRICMKFDIYWNPAIAKMKGTSSQSRMRSYISKTNLVRYVGKTFDDTLDEEEGIVTGIASVDVPEDAAESETPEGTFAEGVGEDVIRYWGTGFTPEMYRELEERRAYWISQYPEGTVFTPGEEGLLRQICNLEIQNNHDRAAGKPIDKSVSVLNNLFGSMNLKPSQKKDEEETFLPFGCEIKEIEDNEPIPEGERDKRFRDVLTWYIGGMCRTAGIKNEWSDLFDEELAKYTVSRPLYDDEDDYGDDDGTAEDDTDVTAKNELDEVSGVDS